MAKNEQQATANPYADFDRAQLKDKMRVFQLAKALGVQSKELVLALADLGIVKVAQSSLTKAESEQLLDALAARNQGGQDAQASQQEAKAAQQKIRDRVRKDVENEIHQIEEKVEAQLNAKNETAEKPAENTAEEKPKKRTAKKAAKKAGKKTVKKAQKKAETTPETVALEQAPLTDVEPEITPVPDPVPEAEEPAAEYAPIFKAPTRGTRRRATRSAVKQPAQSVAEPAAETNEAHEPKPPVEIIEEPKAIQGSARLEAQRRRRSERREAEKKRAKIVSEAEFLARRESVNRSMVVRERERSDGAGRITQVAVLEDGLLVEHFVTSDAHASIIGNVYVGRVQNVLPGMEAAFIDIGMGRNAVLYAGDIDWKAMKLGGRARKVENALKSGDQVLVQVSKDPLGHKGARLTTHISLAGRYLVYVPSGQTTGISRKLPAPERKRLKNILKHVVPGDGGAIIRTAAEGVSEEAIADDVTRLHTQWESIQEQAEREMQSKGAKPVVLYEEPSLLVRVVRDLFNEDFSTLIVDGKKSHNTISAYLRAVAPDLLDRVQQYDRAEHDGQDAFAEHRVDEQIQKALGRMVWLPSGGSLVIDRTEAMTVIDVNTGKFTGSGGSLEETVTSNNLEAAEEIVRQIRLRDIGGMIVIDFIDMILPENQELVLRRLKEALGRDRTRHQVSEVTSLGLVQMTRKRLGTGLLETYSTKCECCDGRGIILTEDPVEDEPAQKERQQSRGRRQKPQKSQPHHEEAKQAESVPAPKLSEEALDQLVMSIVGKSVAEDADAASQQDAQQEEPKPAGRRRGRRGSSRGRGRSEAAQEQQRNESAQEQQRDVESYEEAVAAFEASPRRKRATRGNSRSDHRPRQEDFVKQPAPQQVEEAGQTGQAEQAAGAGQAGQAGNVPGRRKRRRVTRRMSQPAQPQQERSEQDEASQQGRAQQNGATSRRGKNSAQRSRSGSPRRGRRRVTRRSAGN